ncbi:MAG TPA: PDDEXK nuclease domain-containing protein [Chitinophaga sp.]|uniref:PDDEXK nuclease domain-containing protein n=1 Tax=Chitinophaga sp. TaxID=1869181 RepID=UPI002B9B6136|nr:PDDEXK nuclease domain-containing protein [Chitinophaga sp.]HVI43300.1 PDDEXK nuclease domain-containing protein [Chitinophaga sp.]
MTKQFNEIVTLIMQSRNNAQRKVNAELVNLYWQVGEYIHGKIRNSIWGDGTVQELADFIKKNHPELKGFNKRGLYRMRQFYEMYTSSKFIMEYDNSYFADNKRDVIVSTPLTQFNVTNIYHTILVKIGWSHHLLIMSGDRTEKAREFYLRLCTKENYSYRELERQVNSCLFERTMLGNEAMQPVVKEKHPDAVNVFKDRYVFEFLNLPEPHSESDLQKALLQRMKMFILELGGDFCFVSQEHKLSVGRSHFYIDLLFYHRELQCLVAFELKTTEFQPEYIGKLNFYLEALDRDIKKKHENPSVGILLCAGKDHEVVEYAISRTLSPTVISEYQTILPDKQLLQQKLHELIENETLNRE